MKKTPISTQDMAIAFMVFVAGYTLSTYVFESLFVKHDKVRSFSKKTNEDFKTFATNYSKPVDRNPAATNSESVATDKKFKVEGLKSAEIKKDLLSVRSQNLLNFLNSRSKKIWKAEEVSDEQLTLYGGDSKEHLNSDEKALGFAKSLLNVAGFENVDLALDSNFKKATQHEFIDEFSHKHEGVDVYGSYIRLFRDEQKMSPTDVIIVLKDVEEYNSAVLFNRDEIESKLENFYSRLNLQLASLECIDKNYYVDAQKKAQLSYICKVNTSGATPQKFELVVSAQTAIVLFQRTLSIYN